MRRPRRRSPPTEPERPCRPTTSDGLARLRAVTARLHARRPPGSLPTRGEELTSTGRRSACSGGRRRRCRATAAAAPSWRGRNRRRRIEASTSERGEPDRRHAPRCAATASGPSRPASGRPRTCSACSSPPADEVAAGAAAGAGPARPASAACSALALRLPWRRRERERGCCGRASSCRRRRGSGATSRGLESDIRDSRAARAARQRLRHFRPDAGSYLAPLGGPPPYMARLREIDLLTTEHEQGLAEAYAERRRRRRMDGASGAGTSAR